MQKLPINHYVIHMLKSNHAAEEWRRDVLPRIEEPCVEDNTPPIGRAIALCSFRQNWEYHTTISRRIRIGTSPQRFRTTIKFALLHFDSIFL